MNLAVCGRCQYRSCGGAANPCHGRQDCKITGRTTTDHACHGDCPIHAFGRPDAYLCTPAAPPAPEPPPPVPEQCWPLIARWVKSRRQPGEAGLGDTVHRMIGTLTAGMADRITRQLKAAGIDCGCPDRQAWLNQRYPYEPYPPPARQSQTPDRPTA